MQSITCPPQTGAYLALLLYVISFALLITPGVLASVPLLRRKIMRPSFVPLFGFAVVAFCGYLFFWIFLVNPVVGKLISVGAVIMLLLVYLDPYLRRLIVSVLSARDVCIPYLLILAIGLFYSVVTYIGYFDAGVCAGENQAFIQERLLPQASPDYLIQRIWVGLLSANLSPWNHVLDPDLSRTTLADRPPVLAGIALSYFSVIPQALEHYYFMAITSVASLSWIAAVWAIAREVQLSPARSTLFILALSQTFYFYFSSVFTWPKGLSGAMFIGAFCMLALMPFLSSRRASAPEVILGGAFAGLAVLTHNSTMLLLIPLGFVLLAPRLFPGFRGAFTAVMAAALLAIPYMIVKSLNDPSLSNQTKYTLSIPDTSPVEPLEYKPLSIQEAITKAYRETSMQQIIDNKIYNIRSIFHMGCFGKCEHGTMKSGHWNSELMPIAASMKLFNVGWLLFLPMFGFTAFLYGTQAPDRSSEFDFQRIRKATVLCTLLAFIGLLIYALLSFRQEVTNILTSGFMILLFAAVGLRLFALRPVLIGAFFIAQCAYFTMITLELIMEETTLHVIVSMAIMYAIAIAALIVLPFGLFRASTRTQSI